MALKSAALTMELCGRKRHEQEAAEEQLEATLAQLREMDQQRKREGINPKKNPAQLPVTDMDSRILPNKEGGYAANYTPMAVNETENGFIVGADVLIGNVEHLSMTTMIDTIQEDFGVTPETVMGDGVYANGPNLEAMEEREIELLSPPVREEPEENPAVRDVLTEPVADEDLDRLPINKQTKCFDKHAFIYDETIDSFWCPAGKPVPREGTEEVRRSGIVIEQTNYRCRDCAGCPLRARCQKNPEAKQGRKVTRDGYEPIRRRHSERIDWEVDFQLLETDRPGRMDTKALALFRDGYRCRKCGVRVTYGNSEADHIVPVKCFASFQQADVPTNVQILCLACHKDKTAASR